MKQRKSLPRPILRLILSCSVAALLLLSVASDGWTQDNAPSQTTQTDKMTVAVQELQQQVQELRAAVAEVKSEVAEYRAETAELRQELQAARKAETPNALATDVSPVLPEPSNSEVKPDSSTSSTATPQTGSLEQRIASLEDSSALLTGKVDEQHQIKVESASKYRVRLSGIVLMNLFSNRGTVDNQDVPSYAAPAGTYGSNSTFGATLRQSELGLEAFGPDVAGARTSGDVQLDFSGGFPNTLNGVNYGLVRLRTASMRMDWANTSVVAGQDNLFFSPLSPSSFASLSIPAFGYAGNLWGWIPQVRVEHRFNLADGENISVQAGILDNLTGEPPYSQFNRLPQAGESTGQPAYASRVAWTQEIHGRQLSFGGAGYYSRQDWNSGRRVDGWAGMADWNVPLPFRLSFTGEFYRGRALGALGGGVGQSILYSGDPGDPASKIRALNSAGGWSQLKFQATSKLEINEAFGLDNPFARDLDTFPQGVTIYGAALDQNRSALLNFIYRPRSSVLFSAEYRHLRTLQTYSNSYTAEQINLMMGVLF